MSIDLHRAIRHPLWSSASDEELARDHGVSAQQVRELRDQIDRDVLCVEVLSYAREISAAHPGYTLGEIIRLTMRAAARRAAQKVQGSSVRRDGSKSGRAGSDRPGGSGGLRGRQSGSVARQGLGPRSLASRDVGRRGRATGEGERADR